MENTKMKLNFKFLQFFDFILFFCVVALVTFGVLSIYSSGINSEGMNVSTEYVKQIIWGGTGILLMLGLSLVDYRRLSRYVPQIFILPVRFSFLRNFLDAMLMEREAG